MAQYDFGDGKGPVAAHQHSNGGGWLRTFSTTRTDSG